MSHTYLSVCVCVCASICLSVGYYPAIIYPSNVKLPVYICTCSRDILPLFRPCFGA